MSPPYTSTNAASPTLRLPSQELLTRTGPLSPDVLDGTPELDATRITTVEVRQGTEIYGLVSAHITKTSTSLRSFVLDIANKNKANSCCSTPSCTVVKGDSSIGRGTVKGLGLGLHAFEDFEGHQLWALHQTIGEVVGTDNGPALLRNLVLIAPGADDISLLTSFCDRLIADADASVASTFTIYRFNVQCQYWRREEVVSARHIDSVVLPTEMKDKVVTDLDDFLDAGTKTWYSHHGIPYKRSYLLHGSPGAGKTSLIQALAGRYNKNVCFLSSLTHPEMTDDALKTAVQRTPHGSIIVLEDVDALFSAGSRVKTQGDKSGLTFSGVLNALDGVGSSTGQIFILTTNHREALDPALIRCGRVDCHVEFTDATREQMAGLYAAFYPGKPELAEQFAEGLTARLEGKTVSMAQLQHYFILMRKRTAEEAAEGVEKVLEEAAAHGTKMGGESDAEKKSDGEEEKEKEKEKEKEATPTGGDEGEAAAPTTTTKKTKTAAGKDVHVHVHLG